MRFLCASDSFFTVIFTVFILFFESIFLKSEDNRTMPFTCSVPNCNGNYRNGPKVSVFSFPKEPELRRKWIRAIKRDFEPTLHSRVCEFHFAPDDILKESSFFDKTTGRTITAPLKFPRLREDAIPSLMPNCPTYLSNEVVHREAPELRKQRKEDRHVAEATQKSIEEKAEYDRLRQFSSLEELRSRLQYVRLPEKWYVINEKANILFINIIENPAPLIRVSVTINEQLCANVHLGNVTLHKLGSKFTLPMHVTNVNVISDIIEIVNKYNSDDQNDLSLLKDIMTTLKSSMEDNLTYLNFMQEQISLLGDKKIQYTNEMLVFSTLFHTISPHAYKFVRSSGTIKLPHPSTIQRVCSATNLSPIEEQNDCNFLKYISHKASSLKVADKTVNLLIDEIHIKPFIDYKGGNIVGAAHDDKAMATSAHVFMINSITSTYKDVVHILPVKSITYLQLHTLVIKVITGLEKLGFKVISVVTDNNAINRKAMSQFVSPPTLQILYPHPVDKARPLFYVTDPVHLLKSVRNNWLNQKNLEQCMYFPSFDRPNENETFQTASLSALKKLVTCESNSLLKFANSIPMKALSPSNFERQNVKLVLKVFNNFVIQALLELGSKFEIHNYNGTADFIKIILTWWNIMNVKSPYKGVRLNDVHKYPLTSSEDDVKYAFLSKFLDWLENWEKMNCTTGMLTKETHQALKNTTYAMMEIVSYCETELGLKYILPGKFQTDHLESRFSLYRQLAGGQYNVSLRQIFESEKKLRMQSSVEFCLITKSGKVSVTDFDVPTNFDELCEIQDLCNDFPIMVDDGDIEKAIEKLPVIVYVGGYCVYSVLKKLNNCEECKSNMAADKVENKSSPPLQFTMNLDRGQLVIPSPKVVNIVLYTFIVVSKLCFQYAETFLKVNSHKRVATNVTTNVLISQDVCYDFCTNHNAEKIVTMIIWASVNILLNNYCKERNSSQETCSKKRKLQVFSQ